MNFWILDDIEYEQSYNVMSIAGRARQAGKTEMLTAWYKQAIKELCKIAKETNVPIVTAEQKSLNLGEQCLAQDCLASILKGIDFSKPVQTEVRKSIETDYTWCKSIEDFFKATKEKTMKYKIGDRVRVISGKEAKEVSGAPSFVYPMHSLCDKIVTISSIRFDGTRYTVLEDEDGYNWKEEYFVGLAEETKETQMPVYGTTKEKTMTKQELLDKIEKLKKEQQEIEAQLKKMPKYPCIKKSTMSDIVVLFTKKETGTVLRGNGFFDIGFVSDTWNESIFTIEYNAFTVKVGE